MKHPIISIQIDEQGEIQQIHGDLRLYTPLIQRNHLPPLQTLLALTKSTSLRSDGTIPPQNETLAEQDHAWQVDVAPFINPEFLSECPEPERIPAFIQMRSYNCPDTQIDLIIEPTTDKANPQNKDIQVHVVFNQEPSQFDNLLLDLAEDDELQDCLTTFLHLKDDSRYINDVTKLINNVVEMRRNLHRFRMKLTQTEYDEGR